MGGRGHGGTSAADVRVCFESNIWKREYLHREGLKSKKAGEGLRLKERQKGVGGGGGGGGGGGVKEGILRGEKGGETIITLRVD